MNHEIKPSFAEWQENNKSFGNTDEESWASLKNNGGPHSPMPQGDIPDRPTSALVPYSSPWDMDFPSSPQHDVPRSRWELPA